MEPLYVTNITEKIAKCKSNIVREVSSLAKYKEKLFETTSSICAALSSTALPDLKPRFDEGGLPLAEVLI